MRAAGELSSSRSTRVNSVWYTPGFRVSSTPSISCHSSPRSDMGMPPLTKDSSSRSREGASPPLAPRVLPRKICVSASNWFVDEERCAPVAPVVCIPVVSRKSRKACLPDVDALVTATGDVRSPDARSRNAIHLAPRSSSSFSNMGTFFLYASKNAGFTTNPWTSRVGVTWGNTPSGSVSGASATSGGTTRRLRARRRNDIAPKRSDEGRPGRVVGFREIGKREIFGTPKSVPPFG